MTRIGIEVGTSSIHGLGCFAKERVEIGQLVWKFDEGFDLVFPRNLIDSLPEPAKENVLNYAFISRTTGDYILCSDDSRFTNHSWNPNVVCVVPQGASGNELECFAAREILPGDEITNDYREFDAESGDDLDLS